MTTNLGFLASHGGSSARAIVEACRSGLLDAEARVLICNNGGAEAFTWARRVGLPARHLSGRIHPDGDALDLAIRDTLEAHDVELVVLSGYLKKLGPQTVARFRHRILNIHPAPLPRFGGAGMYGLAVHEAVIAAGRTTTEICVHVVDDDYDHGPVVHRHVLPVADTDATQLQARVSAAEPAVFIDALRAITSGELDLDLAGPSDPPRDTGTDHA